MNERAYCALLVYAWVASTLFALTVAASELNPAGKIAPWENQASLRSTGKLEQCGLDSVYIVSRWFDLEVDLHLLVESQPESVFDNGMDLDQLEDLLDEQGLYHAPLDSNRLQDVDFCLDQGFALIIPNQRDAHFYVYLSRREGSYLRYDPPYAGAWVSRDQLAYDYEGYAVAVHGSPIKDGLLGRSGYRSYVFYGGFIALSLGIALLIIGALNCKIRIGRGVLNGDF